MSVCNCTLADLSVVLVEDQSALREIFASMLASFGVERISLTNDGTGAWQHLNQFASSPPHLLVTDLNMPGINGDELISSIRRSADPALQKMPILLMTGDEKYRGCTEVGGHAISGCLIKPFTAMMFRKAIENAMSDSENATCGWKSHLFGHHA